MEFTHIIPRKKKYIHNVKSSNAYLLRKKLSETKNMALNCFSQVNHGNKIP